MPLEGVIWVVSLGIVAGLAEAEPGVGFDLLYSVPLGHLSHEYLLEQVCSKRRDVLWYLVIASKNLVIEDGLALVVKRQVAAQHRVEGYACRPDVYSDGVVQVARYDLGYL